MPEKKIHRINQVVEMLNLSRSTIDRLAKAERLIKVQLSVNSCGVTSGTIAALIGAGHLGS